LVVVSVVAAEAAAAAGAEFSGIRLSCGISRGLRTRGGLLGVGATIAGESEELRVTGAVIASGLATSAGTGVTSGAGALSVKGTAGKALSWASGVGCTAAVGIAAGVGFESCAQERLATAKTDAPINTR
jgi:hypothetical protein